MVQIYASFLQIRPNDKTCLVFGSTHLHCLVLTDTNLYNFTKGKTYHVNQRWRHTTCLQHPRYDVGCYP